jgi:hypothetical protein
MENEKHKGLLEAENISLKHKVEELQRSLQINKETSKENADSLNRNYKTQ